MEIDRRGSGTSMNREDGSTGVIYEKDGYCHWVSYNWDWLVATGDVATWDEAKAAVIAHWDKGE